MPTYTTPTPIDLAINLQVGAVEVVAGDRTDTVVTVSPTSPTKSVDQRGVRDTKVDFDGQRVTVMGPRPRISWIGPGPFDSVDVKVEVPSGSRLTVEIAVGGVRTIGRLGATRIKASSGAADVDTTGDLWLRAGHGSATVGAAEGGAEITADHGQIRVGTVTGDAILKASHGSIQVGESGGDLEAVLSYGDLAITRALASVSARTAYGNIAITTALASVSARTAYGDIALDEVSSGSIQVESGYGQVTIGVRPGVPAWLDLSSESGGRVRNQLDGDRAPDESEPTVAVRARTQHGDITIQRAR